jgi:hypothetical protein
MIDMNHRKYSYMYTVLLIIFLVSCSGHLDAERSNIEADAVLSYNDELFGRDINLTINNRGKKAICFSQTSILPSSPSFTVRQNGSDVPPQHENNRESVAVNGVDVADGLAVVPAEAKRNFFINVEDFALSRGEFTASITFDVLDCAQVFSTAQPLRETLKASVAGTLPSR